MIGALLRIPHRAFAARIHEGITAAGYTDIRPPYLLVFQHIKAEGSRLTELADHALVTKQLMSYLVEYLEEHGYIERVPDPTDGRARLVRLTDKGWELNDEARRIARQVEADWATMVGRERMEALLSTLRDLVRVLDEEQPSV